MAVKTPVRRRNRRLWQYIVVFFYFNLLLDAYGAETSTVKESEGVLPRNPLSLLSHLFAWPWGAHQQPEPVAANAHWHTRSLSDFNLNATQAQYPVAFADWAGTKHAAILFVQGTSENVAINGSHFTLAVATWNAKLKTFDDPLLFQLPSMVESVESVLPIDIDQDGLLDVVVIFRRSSTAYSVLSMRQDPVTRQLTYLWDSSTSEKEHTVVHPFVVDVNSDGYPDLVGQAEVGTESPETSVGGGRFVWLNRQGVDFDAVDFGHTVLQSSLQWNGDVLPALSSPHSSGFLDVNGDCVADLVFDVTSSSGQRSLEVWLATETAESKRAGVDRDQSDASSKPMTYRRLEEATLALPTGAHQVSFVDIDGDGNTDVAVPVCENWDAKNYVCRGGREGVSVIINEQVPLCKRSIFGHLATGEVCRSPLNLCWPSKFQWKAEKFSPLQPLDAKAPAYHFKASQKFPLSLRVGDLDLDGLPDLAVLVQASDDSTGIALLHNEGHGSTLRYGERSKVPLARQQASADVHPVAFERTAVLPEPAPAVPLEAATLFDIDEDGRLDVLAWGHKTSSWWSSTEGSPTMLLVKQDSQGDELFIKFSGLDGACDHLCSADSVSWPMYGATLYGGTLKVTGVDLDGIQFSRSVPFLPQSAYSPYQLPFALVGLGHINNYVDYMFFGSPYTLDPASVDHTALTMVNATVTPAHPRQLGGDPGGAFPESSHRWISLIPNSFVIANTYPRWDPDRWKLELSVSPSRMFWRIFAAMLIVLVAIAIVIVLLDLREKAEDLKEHQGFRRQYIAAV